MKLIPSFRVGQFHPMPLRVRENTSLRILAALRPNSGQLWLKTLAKEATSSFCSS